MSDWKRWFDSPIPNWFMAVISVLMLFRYLGDIEIAVADHRSAWVALAWAVMLGIWLSTAIYKSWFRH